MKSLLISSFLAITLSGCASLPSTSLQGSKIRVTSSPTKATVYASGTKLGTTPLDLPVDAFPTRRVGIIFRPVGTLLVKKQGCQTYSEEVSDALLSDDIKVTLDCNAEQQILGSPDTSTDQDNKPVSDSQAPNDNLGDAIEQQLRRINSLYEKRLVTEDEYQAIRKRILRQL